MTQPNLKAKKKTLRFGRARILVWQGHQICKPKPLPSCFLSSHPFPNTNANPAPQKTFSITQYSYNYFWYVICTVVVLSALSSPCNRFGFDHVSGEYKVRNCSERLSALVKIWYWILTTSVIETVESDRQQPLSLSRQGLCEGWVRLQLPEKSGDDYSQELRCLNQHDT